MAVTAAIHSFFGEKRLIAPLLARDTTVLTQPLSRKVIRFAWHFTSLLMIVSAALVAWPGTPRELVLFAGGAWLAVGVADAIYTRGQHIGWPFLSAAGLFAILGGIL
ncbi:MAG: hypothetical protein AAFW97_09755 [Pseudomonadota bacterium]